MSKRIFVFSLIVGCLLVAGGMWAVQAQDGYSIQGTVFWDANADTLFTSGEPGTPNVTVQLYHDENSNGRRERKEPLLASAVTDANGVYAFTVATHGAYILSVDVATLPEGHALTTGNTQTAAFAKNAAPNSADFNNDFGHVGQPYVEDQVMVKFLPDVSQESIDAILVTYGLQIDHHIASLDVYVLWTQAGYAEQTLILLRGLPEVEWAEMNYFVGADLIPNDPLYSDPTKVYAPQIIDAATAWDYHTGSTDVIVAVLDTGISFSHPEFSGRLLPGWDFISNDADPSDDNGHGTHVAGIIAAGLNNGQGISGMANVRILPVKVLDVNNNGWWSHVASGITYAVDQGAQVINLSLSGSTDSTLMRSAAAYAEAHGVLVVAAAGNASTDTPYYPAVYTNTLTASATTTTDDRWTLSNFGPAIDVAAPGATVYSTLWTATDPNGYNFKSGTSMAAPHVSGLAALLLSARPDLSKDDLKAIITQTADDLGDPGWDGYFGHGRIDAGAAMILAQTWTSVSPTPTNTPLPTNTPTPLPTNTPTPAPTNTPTPLPTNTPTPAPTNTPTRTPTPLPTNTPTPAPASGQRVHSGGTAAFTDGQGQVWAVDQAFTTGGWGYTSGSAASTTTAVAGTTDDALYQRWREAPAEYRFTLPNGYYQVTLRFAEFQVSKSSDRVMRITLEGVDVETSLSIYGLVGKAAALDRTYITSVNDGVLNIAFIKNGGRYNPVVSAVAVQSSAPPPPTATPTPTATPCTTCPTATPTATPQSAPPVISNVSATSITSSGAVILWQTNTSATSQVEYGLTTSYGSLSPFDATLKTSHSVTLTGLKSRKTYYYRVRSQDSAGRLTVSGSFTFKTQ
ncbi:MAG: S8 family serine peptidase [Caldilineales bacterium]|nr:S8 family serine peptidase [Caldilineales bacterium]